MLSLKYPGGRYDLQPHANILRLKIYIWVSFLSLPIRKSEVWPLQLQLQFSACVTSYINNAPHVRRHSCRKPAHFAALYVCASVCEVKGVIHEQLAGVKSG